jgi:hypothetical protein
MNTGHSDKPSIKIQINDIDVLTKLLADENGEIGLEVRNAIVQEFAKRYLKDLAVNFAANDVKELLMTFTKEAILSQTWSEIKYKTDHPFYKMILATMRDVIGNNLKDVNDHIKKVSASASAFENSLTNRLDKITEVFNMKVAGTIATWEDKHAEKIENDFTEFKNQLKDMVREEVQKANMEFFGSMIKGNTNETN